MSKGNIPTSSMRVKGKDGQIYNAESVNAYNSYTHGESFFDPKDNPKYAKLLDDVMVEAKDNIVSYRGTDFEEYRSILRQVGVNIENEDDEFSLKEVRNKILTQERFASTTTQKKYADDYMNDKIDFDSFEPQGYLIKYEIKKGKTKIQKPTNFKGFEAARASNSEITIGRNNKFRLKNIDYDFDPSTGILTNIVILESV